MTPVLYKATMINIFGNLFLMVLKLVAGLLSGSIAILSDAFNSLTDTISSVLIYICVKISDKAADEGHPFGHSRAEPIAGLVVAILAGILGFEVIRASVGRLVDGEVAAATTLALSAPIITILAKGAMAVYFKRVGRALRSPAITASGVDSLCDVYVSVAALVGIVGVKFGFPVLDPIAGILISFWII